LNNKKSRTFLALFRIAILYFGRVLAVSLVFGSVAYGLYYAQHSAYARQRFPVARIDYHGIEHVNQLALDAVVRRTLPDNLLQVDLGHVREIVESEPWVESARVKRVLPDRLEISLDEREPVAVATMDNELYVVDRNGSVLDRYGSRYGSLDGPIVKGLVNLARENSRQDNQRRMKAYLQVIAEFRSSGKDRLGTLSEINVEDPRRVALIPADDPIPVFVGDAAYLKRYETFLSCSEFYQQLKQQYGVIEYVDVTFEDKIIFHTPDQRQRALRAGARF
jgi:cell division septal protein FtsQ